MCKVMVCLASVLVLCVISTSAFGAITMEIPIAADMYDIEEHLDNGDVDGDSSDLELVFEDWDAGGFVKDPQIVGLFFTGVDLDPGIEILEAYVRFDADEVGGDKHAGAANILIRGELADTYTVVPISLGDRTMTDAVAWSPEEWTVKHDKYNTSDISAIVQQIIDQAEWANGGTIALQFSSDPDNPSTGIREAESFDGAGTNVDRRPTLVLTVVPEPATLVLLGVGVLGLLRRKKR